MKTLTKKFILVDDDPLSNMLSGITLKKYFADIEVKDFVNPEVALQYIETEFVNKPLEDKITLFLDINMSALTGWEFLERFKNFPELIQKQFDIYILSSSVTSSDIKLAKNNPLVIEFIEKPLKLITISRLFGE